MGRSGPCGSDGGVARRTWRGEVGRKAMVGGWVGLGFGLLGRSRKRRWGSAVEEGRRKGDWTDAEKEMGVASAYVCSASLTWPPRLRFWKAALRFWKAAASKYDLGTHLTTKNIWKTQLGFSGSDHQVWMETALVTPIHDTLIKLYYCII